MALKSEKYRLVAEEWETRAKRATANLKVEFRKIAAQWRQLAKDAENIEKIRRRIEKMERG